MHKAESCQKCKIRVGYSLRLVSYPVKPVLSCERSPYAAAAEQLWTIAPGGSVSPATPSVLSEAPPPAPPAAKTGRTRLELPKPELTDAAGLQLNRKAEGKLGSQRNGTNTFCYRRNFPEKICIKLHGIGKLY